MFPARGQWGASIVRRTDAHNTITSYEYQQRGIDSTVPTAARELLLVCSYRILRLSDHCSGRYERDASSQLPSMPQKSAVRANRLTQLGNPSVPSRPSISSQKWQQFRLVAWYWPPGHLSESERE